MLKRLAKRALDALRRAGRSKKWHKRASNNVAKKSLIPDTVISRTELRPQYGQGSQPRLGSRPRQGNIRDLGKEDTP